MKRKFFLLCCSANRSLTGHGQENRSSRFRRIIRCIHCIVYTPYDPRMQCTSANITLCFHHLHTALHLNWQVVRMHVNKIHVNYPQISHFTVTRRHSNKNPKTTKPRLHKTPVSSSHVAGIRYDTRRMISTKQPHTHAVATRRTRLESGESPQKILTQNMVQPDAFEHGNSRTFGKF